MDESAVLIGHRHGHKDDVGTGAEDRLLRCHSRRYAGQHERDCRTSPGVDARVRVIRPRLARLP